MEGRDYSRLLAWRRAMALAIDVCRATGEPAFRREWSLRDQLRRAAISVPSNIAEGNERGSDKDGVRFFYYAKGSLAELATQARIVDAIGLLPANKADGWIEESRTISRMLAGLISSRLK